MVERCYEETGHLRKKYNAMNGTVNVKDEYRILIGIQYFRFYVNSWGDILADVAPLLCFWGFLCLD